MKTYWWLSIAALMVVMVLPGCRGEQAAMAQDDGPPQPVATRVVGGLQEPVALAFLSKDVMLVAERKSGRILWVQKGQLREQPFAVVEVPTPAGYNEYGLLGLAVDPTSKYVYAFHTVKGPGGKAGGQRIVRFTVKDGQGQNPTTIVDNLPAGQSCCHNGGRIAFGPDDKLYVTLGDTQQSDEAQQYEALPGKILRYNPDGTVPADNPLEKQTTSWAGTEGDNARAVGGNQTPVYAIGLRNPFGIAFEPDTGELYVTDNGPDADDEVDHIVAADNYGWPVVMGYSSNPRYHNPLWSSGKPTIAPTGMAFYAGSELPQFDGNLFFAAYKDGKLRRAVFSSPDKITTVAVVPEAGNNARLAVQMGPDGALYYTSMDAVYRLGARR